MKLCPMCEIYKANNIPKRCWTCDLRIKVEVEQNE
jgi:hypothetical protein